MEISENTEVSEKNVKTEIANLRHITYTHSDCEDVWNPHFGRLDKHFPSVKKCVFVNRCEENDNNYEWATLPNHLQQWTYDDTLSYPQRLAECLQYIEEDYVLFTHEDFILYSEVDIANITSHIALLESVPNLSFVRLIRCGDPKFIKYRDGLSRILKSSSHVFAIQPTLWKRDVLLDIVRNTPADSIWQFEVNANYYCKNKGITGLYSYHGGAKRGRSHWDSDDYPYIATAVVKGKWNTSEYPRELEQLFKEFEIDKDLRGVNVPL